MYTYRHMECPHMYSCIHIVPCGVREFLYTGEPLIFIQGKIARRALTQPVPEQTRLEIVRESPYTDNPPHA